MRRIAISEQTWYNLVNGLQNVIIIDESDELLVTEPVELLSTVAVNESTVVVGALCSVNWLSPKGKVDGLAKGHTLVGVSVQRHLTHNELVDAK